MIGILSSGRILNKNILGDKYSQGISIPINYDNAYNYGVNNNPYALKQIIDNNTGEEHNFNWDLKGNMIYHKDINAGNERHLCWTEDNRLQAVKDNKMGAYYNYDASGERNLKLTGGTVDVVGEPVFYYHSDHLGSASYITDSSGNETQHLVYLPFGEDWVDWKYNTSQFETPFKFNGKEKDPETGYNYYGARYLNTDLSIWLSVDPMSDKYPHLTSYNYCANNPVMLVDPDGRDVIIAGEDGSQYNYGKDPKYEGSDKFILKAVSAINKIASRKEGKSMINELVNSKNVFNVEEGQESKFEASNQLKAFAKKISEDNPNFPTSLLEGGSGGTIKWNTNGAELPTEGGLGKDATMDLAHEFSHGLDANRGMFNEDKFENRSKNEWQAVYRENLIRAEHRLPLRTGYGVKRYPNGEVKEISTRMLKDGKNVRPIWYK